MGKLLVIDGLDGCGKSTQLDLLDQALSARNESFRTMSNLLLPWLRWILAEIWVVLRRQ